MDIASLQARIADEIADVLVDLLQIAEKTGLDTEQAAWRQLEKYALKQPPRR